MTKGRCSPLNNKNMEDSTMNGVINMAIRAERTGNKSKGEETSKGKLSRIATYENGLEVAIPINKDGSIKWLDDSLFMKKSQ